MRGRSAAGFALVVLLSPLSAAEEQIDWVADFDKAFAIAKERKCPVMVCFNSKDREKANDRTAKDIYRDPEFVALSRSFAMVVISTLTHKSDGPCPRFGVVTCAEHLQCYKTLAAKYGDRFSSPSVGGEIITPQHAWFSPDGNLLARKEYWMDKHELLQRMQRALDELASEGKEKGPGEEAPQGAPPAGAPLSDPERADLVKAEGPDSETRRAALGNLLSTEKPAARAAVIDLLKRTTDAAVKCDAIRALGRAQVIDARATLEAHLEHKEPLVRSFAAVSLELLAQKESVEPLLKRVKSERDLMARKNACRALGACGGPVADEEAASTLLKTVAGDKQNVIRKHAALSLRAYSGEKAAPLVRAKLEQLALKTKDRVVRGGIVFTLAYVGTRETTEPVLKGILDDQHDEWGKAFVREALKILRHESGDFGRAAWFLFAEDRDDPARRDDLPSDIPPGGG